MLNLNIPLQKLFRWLRRPQLWATGGWQLHGDNAPAHASCLVQSFVVKHQITAILWLLSRFGTLQLLAFPKPKITFQLEELCEVPGAYFDVDWGVLVLCTMFLVSCIFFNKCLYFSYYMAGYLQERPCKILKVGLMLKEPEEKSFKIILKITLNNFILTYVI